MTAGRRYLLGIASVAVAVLALGLALPPEPRAAVWLALGVAAGVQGPLGWWLVGAIGAERFFLEWAIGIAVRFAVVTACGLVVAPRLRLALEPMLFALVGVLMCFVLLEAIVIRPAGPGRRGTEVR